MTVKLREVKLPMKQDEACVDKQKRSSTKKEKMKDDDDKSHTYLSNLSLEYECFIQQSSNG